MRVDDLEAALGLSQAVHWPHRLTDWRFAFELGGGLVAERDGEVVATAMSWPWGETHATLGLVIVDPRLQGRRIGLRLMQALLDGLEGRTVLLHATAEGRGLYERLGFVRTGEVRQHQGQASSAPLMALDRDWRLRPSNVGDLPALVALDARARGMPRDALVRGLYAEAQTVVLDHDGERRGFAMLRRFGRGLIIGPVVAPDEQGAKALIAHLVGLNAGKFVRIDVDFDSGLTEWLEELGLPRVDGPTEMIRGDVPEPTPGVRRFALATQALG
ncbi:GNAT family N-acetyltransferase [Roseateles aquatilis]|uniref:GNAT family N-acetyltransferase n=1 Tax=Roseateles aquatilis TaxID=431061 RepID=A0A246IUH7_9BURK|nr:GNAT family N-acetyltransferase [Roseateles aquatilis]OWQ83856.1 GNAT family N-acetyltransferase [Roseateles aquatilis]